MSTKIGPREQQLRDMRERQLSDQEKLRIGRERSEARPKWKKQLGAIRANQKRKDRRKP